MDFAKVFDTVSHRKLIFKFKNIGLNDRMQYVELQSYKSTTRPMVSRVPQGSVLGPLHFLIYINDSPNRIKSHCRLFADDGLIYNTADNFMLFKEDLLVLEQWSKEWQITFNVSKCAFLQIGKMVGHPGYYLF